MDVTVFRDQMKYTLHFEQGENVGAYTRRPAAKKTGTRIRWKPDLAVFTDIAIPDEYFYDVLKKQAVVNAGVTFRFRKKWTGHLRKRTFDMKTGSKTMWWSWRVKVR